MKNVKRLFAILAAVGILLSCSVVAMAADQLKTRDQDRDRDRDRDGSCQTDIVQLTDQNIILVQYNGDDNGKGDMDRARDESCQDEA